MKPRTGPHAIMETPDAHIAHGRDLGLPNPAGKWPASMNLVDPDGRPCVYVLTDFSSMEKPPFMPPGRDTFPVAVYSCAGRKPLWLVYCDCSECVEKQAAYKEKKGTSV